jgi:RND family efflux transporter MFP subunit
MSSSQNRRTRSPRWLAALLLLALGAAGGWTTARTANAAGENAAPSAAWEAAKVERRDLRATVLATGVVRPKVGAQVVVGSRASGVVERLHVTVGDRVRAGQLLAELDPTEFETQVERAEAARLNAVAEREYAEGELTRTDALVRSGASTPGELANARRAAEIARAREREAAAALAAARVQLGYATIRAPIGGVVATVSTQEGETVAASFASPTFVTIVDLSRLEVWAYVDETDIGRIRVGQRARFRVDTYPDDAFQGTVTQVRPTAELRDNVVNYITLIEVEPRPELMLRPEMTATIDIETEGRSNALAVPNAAVRRDAQGAFVLTGGVDGLQRRPITIGFRGSEHSEVTSGLDAGDSVLVGAGAPCAVASTPTEPVR